MKDLFRLMRPLRGWGRAWHVHFTLPFIKTCGAAWRRARAWGAGLQLRLFLQGLPALLAGVGLVVLTAFSLMAPAYEVEARYLEQGRAAFQARDYPLALTCFERVCAQGERPEVLFEMAQTAEVLKQQERTELLMRQLAPADRQGYADAHVWWAVRLLQQTPQTKAHRDEAQAHLVRALRGTVTNRTFAHGVLGDLYLVDGQWEKAEEHLGKAVAKETYLLIRLAVAYERLGKAERAREEAGKAVNIFQRKSKENPSEPMFRLRWAEAATFLKQHAEAAAVLEAGWAAKPLPVYKEALGQVYADWVGKLKDKAAEPLPLIEKGLAHDPRNLTLLNRLLAVVTAGGAEADKARATLQHLLARGEAAGLAHLGLGVDAIKRGDPGQARVHWEQALQLAPHLVEVANNLAMLLAQEPLPLPLLAADTVGLAGAPGPLLGALALYPGSAREADNLTRALKLINMALEKFPKDANFRDTRGQIYLKMARWKDALPDLEAALFRYPDSVALHRRLATVYAGLGVQDMAAEHRRLAEQLLTDARKKPNR